MRAAPSAVERFRAAVARRLGLHFDDSKVGFLAEVLNRRLAPGHSADDYLTRLEAPGDVPDEVRALAAELTVGETYFFRHPDQFRAFAEAALPDRLRARDRSRTLRILSAGCASGEEALTIAIILRERLGNLDGWQVRVEAVDVNPSMLARAAQGRYSAWSLRDTPGEVRERWFRGDGRDFVVDQGLRAMVCFAERNLVEDDHGFWQADAFDIVFCRNLLMYLTPEHARALVERITRALAPGGFLFLGHAETLRGLTQDFRLLQSHGCFYYHRRQEPASPSWRAGAGGDGLAAGAQIAAAVEAADSWVDAIGRASERIRALAESPGGRTGTAQAARARPAWDLHTPIELLGRERFAEALSLVRGLPPESGRDPDTLLLRAALLTHSGELPEAERVCRELLDLDELSAPAHYLMALCREADGDAQGAREHDLSALYLDPGFAMPHFHLGLLARRAGDRDHARRELGQALALLQREDASRLLLFGGGFGREALVALCRAEILACGGTV